MPTSTKGKGSEPSSPTPATSALQIDFATQIEQHAPWETWAEKLINRKKPVQLRKLLPANVRDSLLWSVSGDTSPGTVDLVKKLSRLKKDRSPREPADWCAVVDDWIQRSRGASYSVDYALECVGWTNTLARLAPRLTAQKWWELAANLIDCASEALTSMVLDTKHSHFDSLHIGQLLTCELPLALAYWFPRIDHFRAMGARGTAALSESLIELLDGEGMPHGRHVANVRLLLACWTRSVYLSTHGPGGRIDRDAQLQFEWLVRQTLRFRRGDGTLAFDASKANRRLLNDLVVSALAIAGDDTDEEIFAVATDKKKKLPAINHLPTAGEHSEWAEFAILRTDWTTDAALCAVRFDGESPTIELSVGKRVLAKGVDPPVVRVNGKNATASHAWEEICWESDDDGDYIELQTRLEHGLIVQRQIVLFRDEMLLYTADAVLGATHADIEYERRFPFAEDVSLTGAEETREVTINLRGIAGQVLPLALPEWQAGHHFGSLSEDGVLKQSTRGDALYAPMLIDLNPKRVRKQLTWRQLTVAERLQIVGADVAVAYRVQMGKEQWLIYRSLAPKANRTFLGQNHSTEFLFARFSTDGDIENLVEVE